MIFKRFEVPGLAHFSYVVGCLTAGKGAVVDPRRDVDVYIQFATKQGLEITHVLETHIHADYVSGARELVHLTGAQLCLSAYDTDERYEVVYPHRDLSDGEAIELGSVQIRARHTPGHTPEHLSFLIYDCSRSSEVPMIMLSGDFLFVGALGRPDLLGEDQKQAMAEQLYASVRNTLTGLPDGLEIHPAHGAGSMCGAGMSGRSTSTLGFERIANPYLQPDLSQGEFIEKILSALQPAPPYFQRMKRVNSEGPPFLDGLPGLNANEASAFRRFMEEGYLVIDLRDQVSFGAGHIPGSFGIGAGVNFPVWASWVVPYETPLLLVSPDRKTTESAVRGLVRVGLDDVRGDLEGGMEGWLQAGYPVEHTTQLTPEELQQRMQEEPDIQILDVRTDAERGASAIPGSLHIRCNEIRECLDQVPTDGGALVLVCGSGYRSTVAASILERAGFKNLINLTGGMMAWQRDELLVERA